MTSSLYGQPMFRVLAAAQHLERKGRQLLHFEIGDLGFQSPSVAAQAANYALVKGETNYTDSRGLFELREAVIRYARHLHGVAADMSQVLITPANAAIDFTFRCVADPGDEIVVPDPCFPTYASVANYAGIVLRRVSLRSEESFRFHPSDVAAAITDRTRLIVLNSPHNPTGACLATEDAMEIYRIAEERGIYILSDEVYARLLYDNRHFSVGSLDDCTSRTIILGSLSKSHAMAGWRLGYLLGPSPFVEKATLLLQTILSCLPGFTQRGAIAALGVSQKFYEELLQPLRLRRDLLVNGLNQIPGCQCAVPGGAFYVFPKMQVRGLSDDEYAARLLDQEGVCLLPGHYFGAPGKGHMRISFAASSNDAIKEALRRIERFHSHQS